MADHMHVVVTGGVDTHKDFHVAAALDERGRTLGSRQFPVSGAGYAELWRWLASLGTVAAVGVEGTGSWGAGLARYLTAHNVAVVEVNRPNRQHRRRHGKSDPADAEAAARAVLAGDATGTPKLASGTVEAIRMLRVARRSAIKARTQSANQMHSLLDTAPTDLHAALGELRIARLASTAARFRPVDVATPNGAARYTLRSLARRWSNLTAEIADLDRHLNDLVASAAPDLVAIKGVGTDTAGALLVAAGDNPQRVRSEAAFAALTGTSPVDASSGRQHRHRLNRGGNREANTALYMIIVNRLSHDPRTKTYLARRLTEGKTKKEAIRCLKRYVARELYNALPRTAHTPPEQPPTTPKHTP